jgi:hypothetical protein
MVESSFPADRPADLVCPWCSAPVTPETTVCSSCRAILISGEERDLPGVTAVDQAIVRGEKKAVSRSRLLSWISGEYVDDTPTVSDSQALAPPDPDVQREILRLELEAEVANLQAEADAMYSEAVAEGRVADLPDAFRSFVLGEAVTDLGEAPAEPSTEAEPDASPTASDDAPSTVDDMTADGEPPPA